MNPSFILRLKLYISRYANRVFFFLYKFLTQTAPVYCCVWLYLRHVCQLHFRICVFEEEPGLGQGLINKTRDEALMYSCKHLYHDLYIHSSVLMHFWLTLHTHPHTQDTHRDMWSETGHKVHANIHGSQSTLFIRPPSPIPGYILPFGDFFFNFAV